MQIKLNALKPQKTSIVVSTVVYIHTHTLTRTHAHTHTAFKYDVMHKVGYSLMKMYLMANQETCDLI